MAMMIATLEVGLTTFSINLLFNIGRLSQSCTTRRIRKLYQQGGPVRQLGKRRQSRKIRSLSENQSIGIFAQVANLDGFANFAKAVKGQLWKPKALPSVASGGSLEPMPGRAASSQRTACPQVCRDTDDLSKPYRDFGKSNVSRSEDLLTGTLYSRKKQVLKREWQGPSLLRWNRLCRSQWLRFQWSLQGALAVLSLCRRRPWLRAPREH